METLAKIPSSITTPIALAAFVLVFSYGVYKLLFEHKLLSKIDSPSTAVILSHIINWAGVLALVTLALALSPAMIASFPPPPSVPSPPPPTTTPNVQKETEYLTILVDENRGGVALKKSNNVHN